MVGCLAKCAVKLVMKNHYYSFNNQIRKQGKGGAIGNSLTEKLAKLLLKRFDRKFKALINSLKIALELYRRYVDDIMAALAALAPGTRLNKEENNLEIMTHLIESDKEKPADQRTFEELRQIANSIYTPYTVHC